MPKPPESGVYRSARGHRTRSDFRNTFAKGVLNMSEILWDVTEMRTVVKSFSLK